MDKSLMQLQFPLITELYANVNTEVNVQYSEPVLSWLHLERTVTNEHSISLCLEQLHFQA